MVMKLLIQRVTHAKVKVDDAIVGNISSGALVFIGVTHDDTTNEASWLANKLINLRMFEDSQGKINQSVLDQKGELLINSQFTLYADCSAGRRPSFTKAAQPELAKFLYEQFLEELRRSGLKVESGVFGAEMKVSLTNDGPVTLILERSSSNVQ